MKKGLICIVVLTLCTALLCGCTATGLENSMQDYHRGGETISSEVESLEVNWTAGSITIDYHSENTVILSETAERAIPEDEVLLWKLDGKTLKIEYHKPNLLKLNTLAKDLTITLPEDLKLSKVTLHATSADLRIPALAAEEAVLETTSGNMEASLQAEIVKASSTSGGIALRCTGKQESVDLNSTSGNCSLVAEEVEKGISHATSGSLTLEATHWGTVTAGTTSGWIEMKAKSFREMKLSATSGNINAALSPEPGFSGTLSVTSGEIFSTIPLEHTGDTYSCGDGSSHLDISTTSGDISLRSLD